MKKLYRKGTVHPSPPPVISDQHLAFLPSAILTLAAALSPEDREVLAYLLSCSGTYTSGNRKTTTQKSGDHPPLFNCNCFRCYTSYWVKWDSSPNRQLIHEIIDAVEDGLVQSKNPKSRKERRRKGGNGGGDDYEVGEKTVLLSVIFLLPCFLETRPSKTASYDSTFISKTTSYRGSLDSLPFHLRRRLRNRNEQMAIYQCTPGGPSKTASYDFTFLSKTTSYRGSLDSLPFHLRRRLRNRNEQMAIYQCTPGGFI
ncbi:unnamed protein product, partial [Vitis vinifera]